MSNKPDTIQSNGQTFFVHKGNADDFNYLCFYVNQNPRNYSWEILLNEIILDSMSCELIIDKDSS
ncbi:hypothetical protein [Flexithrix dorotheae]|uniref:hypothetical protein n=1 Tax=Flexithrix dorotheae TaxID=70993 RepID=UPI00036C2C8E|nr:hypothetical protein [Flexithrix dorotheae]